MTPARRASILLLIVGGFAALMGVAAIAAAPTLATVPPPPYMQKWLDDAKQTMPISMQTMFVVAGVVTLLYAVAAVLLGILVRGAGRVTVILTLMLAAMVTGLMAIRTGVALLVGAGGEAVFSVGLTVAHAAVVKWMIQTLQRTTPVAAPLPPASRKPPLADYYFPPLPPA